MTSDSIRGTACRAALLSVALSPTLSAQLVVPDLIPDLVCYYDFEHPVPSDTAKEVDQGSSNTPLNLINGGGSMRHGDGAFPASAGSLETRQVSPLVDGNDDWKAGVYQAGGVPSLSDFGSVRSVTLMGWIKPTGEHPAPNSTTASQSDVYNAVGLFGLLSGNSDGHSVRALVEVITVSGTLKLVALGRRIDTGSSLILAADQPWQSVIPNDTWTHIAATFDFDAGTMALFRNGQPLAATYTAGGDPWGVNGGTEPDVSSPAAPAGIKIGGSYPQNTDEKNSFNGRLDDLMFFKRTLTAAEIKQQYDRFLETPAAKPDLHINKVDSEIRLSWSAPTYGFVLESNEDPGGLEWDPVRPAPIGDNASLTLPIEGDRRFFRLRRP